MPSPVIQRNLVNLLVRRPLQKILALMNHAEVNKKLENSLKDISTLYQISESLAKTLEEAELIQTIKQVLTQSLPSRKFALLLLDHKGENLKIAAVHGFSEDSGLLGRSIFLGEGICGRGWLDKKTISIDDVELSKDFFFHRDEVREKGSLVAIPLLVGEKAVGILAFGHPGKETFEETERQFLTSLANQVAVSVDRSRLYMRTKALSVRDELTGLYNRRHFQDVLRMEWKRALRFNSPLSLLMIDVDHFKDLNDSYGHVKGDQILRDLGRLLSDHVREVDTVSRFGGEEFVVVLPDTDLTDALHVGEKLKNLVEDKSLAFYGVTGSSCKMTVSIGASSYPRLAESEEDLLNTADIALYRAKAMGRNCVISYERERGGLGQTPSVMPSRPRLLS